MIQANFTNQGGTISITVKGHAGTAPVGEDIVCAAASILFNVCSQYADTLYKGGSLLEEPVIDATEGDAKIIVKPIPERMPLAMHTFTVISMGYDALQENFPLNVGFKSFGQA